MKSVLVVLVALLLIGCTATHSYRMDLASYIDPDAQLREVRTFSVVSIGQSSNELMEKELMVMLRKVLEYRGFVEDGDNPDVLVSISGFVGSYQQYIPPRTISWWLPDTKATKSTTSGFIGSTYLNTNTTSRSTELKQYSATRSGHTVTMNYRNIQI